jgi:16S rRNA (uracil1498-N3)-methyltransferase
MSGEDSAGTGPAPRRRLHVEGPLTSGVVIQPNANQAHWLLNVVRLGVGDEVAVFDGVSGEWRARVAGSRKRPVLEVEAPIRLQEPAPDLWLLFAPIKGARVELIAEKATELGVARLVPVITRRTVHARVNVNRIRANAVEAAEQCGGLLVPEVAEPRPLGDVLGAWDPARRLLFCDEEGGPPALLELGRRGPGPWAILVGPEGGFDEAERALLGRLPYAVRVSLGRRVLRAETAATAALALWHAVLDPG